MFGWLSDAATRISRRNRGEMSSGDSGCRRLIATRRPSSQSSARNTDAIAPEPSRRIIRNRLATSRDCSDTRSICPLLTADSRRDEQALERGPDRGRDLDRPTRLSIDEDMDEPARGRGLRPGLRAEQRDLVSDARAADVPDAQRRLDGLGERERRVERAVRLGADADDVPAVDVEAALLDEPRVDHGVEERVVLDVVDVAVDVVVLPARRDRAAVGEVGGGGDGGLAAHGPHLPGGGGKSLPSGGERPRGPVYRRGQWKPPCSSPRRAPPGFAGWA